MSPETPTFFVSFLAEEYQSLNQQLDNLNSVLDVLEQRSDNLQEEAKKLVRDMRESREQRATEATEQVQEADSSSGGRAKEGEGSKQEEVDGGNNVRNGGEEDSKN